MMIRHTYSTDQLFTSMSIFSSIYIYRTLPKTFSHLFKKYLKKANVLFAGIWVLVVSTVCFYENVLASWHRDHMWYILTNTLYVKQTNVAAAMWYINTTLKKAPKYFNLVKNAADIHVSVDMPIIAFESIPHIICFPFIYSFYVLRSVIGWWYITTRYSILVPSYYSIVNVR